MATDKLVDFDHVTDYISRDAAIDAVENDPEIRPRAEATVVAFWECGAKVKMAPTIIEAEGGGEK